MYELVKITENCFYIDCPSKIGVVKTGEDTVVLIDSGSDKDAAKKAKKQLDALGLKITAVYNTHSNADHIGGNKYLKEQTGCKIYAPSTECAFTRHPILEPAYLFGGFPPKALKNKFFLAEPSDAEYLSEEALPNGFKIIELPGHFFDMVGFITPDSVAYIADCLSSSQTLKKYGIGVIFDVEKYIETLENIKKLDVKYFVPSHAEVCENIEELANININAVYETAEKITAFLKDPKTFDELMKNLFDDYNLSLSIKQYALVGSSVKSYLSYLLDNEKITCFAEDNRLVWQAV
ncbi:MAG: MBL fold metallo-hydrolase [Clostridia bacterium]|nr:MBL fold metallo-hydrolase [Clostridia bacterium]